MKKNKQKNSDVEVSTDLEKTKEIDLKKKKDESTLNKKSKEKKSNLKGNVLFILIVLVFIAIFSVSSYYSYKYFTKKEDYKGMFTKEDLPRVDASLATQPLMDKYVKYFTDSDIKIDYTNTHPAYEKLAKGETDLIIVTYPSKTAKDLLDKNDVDVDIIPVVNEGFVFFVNKENKVDNLTLKQVQSIYTGDVTNWKDLGGDDAKILAYQRPDTSGSQTGLKELVMKDLKIKSPTIKEYVPTMSGVIDYVADYKDDKRAIAYSYYYYANVMYANDNIKFLGIDGVKPNFDTIRDGSYPLLTSYYIVINKNVKEDSNVRKLVNAMLSEQGQKLAMEAGYVPVK